MPIRKKPQEDFIEDIEAVPVDEDEIEHPIESALNVYIEHIESLYKTLFITMVTLSDTFDETKASLDEFEKRNCEIGSSDEDGNYTVIIHEKHFRKWNKLQQDFKHIALASKLVPASFLTSIISQYDGFLGQLIKALFDLNPEMLNSSERNLSYAQLADFGSIADARAHIVEKEIETVLRKSHAEQFDWLEKKFDLPLRKDLSIWPTFIEVTERRNLFVHTRGIVSSQYVKVCKQHGVKLDESIIVGAELSAPVQYMKDAYACVLDMGIQLAHVLWRKKDAKTRKLADANLNDVAYELLSDKKYSIAIRVLDFAVNTIKKFSSEETRRYFIINRALAYKWSGNDKVASKIIESEDWSATSDKLKLAECVVLENYSQADSLVKKIGKDDSLSAADYREWPLFLKYREREEFKEVFKSVFGEELELIEYPIEEVSGPNTHMQDDVNLSEDSE